ncbi:sulfhydryl oxidase 1-like [Zingiber officinale]|uniref:sulfhydryl oxidase 1-like n=1 Tax=Zingiber officinale TaxID=94328 RepID=UPI001C4DBC88|nr:sulfhydryl oxidase 1-like [Zingiber officinale]
MPPTGSGFLLVLSLSFLLCSGLDALRALGDRSRDVADAAVELNASNFRSFLKESPLKFAVVEFFAGWCPACRNYKPQYEKVASLFNGPDAVHSGIILLARVDCALETNTDLCGSFSVSHYPMLFWGPPNKFSAGRWDPKKNNEIQLIDEWRTADLLLNYLNKKIGSSFTLGDEKYENENTLARNASDPAEIARAIYDVEEATAQAFKIIFQNKMIKSNTRGPLIKFLQLLVVHHPSKRCRKGSAEMLVNFNNLWPSDLLSMSSQETNLLEDGDTSTNYQICGKEIPRGYWIFCRGSIKGTRGFSCGLWVLFHSLSVRVGDEESNLAFMAICDFIQNFFTCDDCRRHFHVMTSSISEPLNKTRDLALWLWSAHNKVNKRLREKENELKTFDPRFPKILWPPKQLCPSCYKSSNENNDLENIIWDEDEVFKFLVNYYGRTIASLQEESYLSSSKAGLSPTYDITPSNAVVVPVGAALAIAVVSCAFGALACFWRTQQKTRKQRKTWN